MFLLLYGRITLSIRCIFPYKFTFFKTCRVQVNRICSFILSVLLLFYILRFVTLYLIFSCATRWYICLCLTNHALVSPLKLIKKYLDNDYFVCGVFIDLQKAIDTVNHVILFAKIEHCGVLGQTKNSLGSFLTN